MIDPKELRMGDWVEYCGRHRVDDGFHWHYQICALERKCFSVFNTLGSSEYADFQYIKLTPEIIEACGFKPGFGQTYYKNYDKTVNKYKFPKIYAFQFEENGKNDKYTLSFHYFGNGGYSNEEEEICEFEYLHELQNLVFSLTKEEITYKPFKKVVDETD